MTFTHPDPSHLNLRDALDLAILSEMEAEERYRDFAAQLEVHATPAAAAFFAELAGEERKHHDQLLARRQALFGSGSGSVTSGMLWDIEAPGFDQAQMFMSTRRALAVALAAEGKARAFFADCAQRAVDPEARALFAELEIEEAGHQERVKRQLAKLPADAGGEADMADPPVAQ